MNKISSRINNRLEIIIVIFTIFLFIFRTAIPFFKYPFVVFYLIVIIYSFLRFRLNSKLRFIKLLYNNILVIFLFLIFVVWLLFSSKLYLVIFKDVINTIVLFSFFFFLSIIITTKEQFNIFVYYSVHLIICFAFFISIKRLWDLGIPDESVAKIDYNFALLPVLFGIGGILNKLLKKRLLNKLVLYNLLLFLFTLDIIFSGSRRGFLIFVLFINFIIFSPLLKKITLLNLDNLLKNTKIFFCLLFSGFFLIIIFLFSTSEAFKNNTLKRIGFENVIIPKREITLKTHRYISFFNQEYSYNEWFDRLWSSDFNPKDPESGWGYRISEIVYPLKGKNVNIVPNDCKGYLMNFRCNSDTRINNAYSSTVFKSLNVEEGDQVLASVYCYVSEEFDGTWVRLTAEGSSYGRRVSLYNLKKKGEWQKLKIEPLCNKGSIPLILYWAKYGVNDFKSVKGYVIFANPTYKVISVNDTVSDSRTKTNTSISIKRSNDIFHKGNVNKASIFTNFNKLPLLFNQISNDPDPIRKWIKNIFHEDTTYYGLKSEIKIDINSKDVMHERTDRWQFAWQIFKKEYNWKQKIFGHGFDYLNWYGYYFHHDKTKSDWPHNPFLSVLLYSGLLGLGLYLVLMYKVVSIYLKYIKEYYILFIFFGITFFFSFFSANSPFNPPVMGFFMMLPFFIDYIHKKDKSI